MASLSAGGGEPEVHAVMKSVPSLSASTLSYLKAIARGERSMSAAQLSQLRSFTTSESSANVDTGDAKPNRSNMDLHALLAYMTSAASNAVSLPTDVDLSYPISNYFISSSHNTYLDGNQLYGASTTAAYKNVLLRGCRCVEIDVWDGEGRLGKIDAEEQVHRFRPHLPRSISAHLHGQHKTRDATRTQEAGEESLEMPIQWTSASTSSRAEPRVLHGHTMTKEISFRDVCNTIREFAFVHTDLPVIVSLEIHTRPEQQEVMVEIMKDSWKGMLASSATESFETLPSPDKLRGKILVKVKPSAAERSGPKSKPAKSSSPASNSDSEHPHCDGPVSKKKGKIIEALSALSVYTHAYHFKGFLTAEATNPTHVFSLSEKKLMELHEGEGPGLFTHNRNFMMRAFPSATRVSSSNLDPSIFWRKGVQMVALNWQRWDAGMMLNEAMFTGGSGWALKPVGYRGCGGGGVSQTTAVSQVDAIQHTTLELSVELLAAQDLPLPFGDTKPERLRPYVKCELHIEKPEEREGAPIPGGGLIMDGEYKRRSNTVKGVDPDLGGELLSFSLVPGVVEELSFIRFKVQDNRLGKDELMAWACIRLDRFLEGYRFIHLFDVKGMESPGTLFVKIIKRAS